MATHLERYPRARYVGLALAFTLSMAVVAALSIVGSTLYDEEAERASTGERVSVIAAEASTLTDSYFSGPESVAQVVARAVVGNTDATGTSLLQLLNQLTDSHENIVGTFIAFPTGDVLVAHADDTSIGAELIVDRWFGDTAPPSGPVWTNPHSVPSTGQPAITHGAPVYDANGDLIGVVGVEVLIADLGSLLTDRLPSTNGNVLVMDGAGSLIVGPSTLTLSGTVPEDPVVAAMLTDLASKSAGVDEPGPWVDNWDNGRSARVVATNPVGRTAEWFLVVDIPESDFLLPMAEERRRYGIAAALIGLLSTLAFVGAALWITRHIAMLRRLASTDQLTGTLNRATARRELERALLKWEHQGELAAMILDIDDFKVVNDQFGHDAGDHVLLTTTKRLVEAAGPDAVVGRLGGDEFLVIVPPGKAGARYKETFNAIIERLALPIDVAGFLLEVHASAGYSTQPTNCPKTASQMLTEADVALYDSKEIFGTSILRFDSSMQLRSARDHSRQLELETAIRRDEFAVHFQPEFDLVTDELLGAEALLRWDHPTDGIIAAGAFIEDLERFGLLDLLLPQILDEATEFALNYAGTEFTIRVNLAAEQLVDHQLMPLLVKAVNRAPDARFCLEVTERSVLEASPTVLATLGKMRALDIEVALDDFGTGYSSLKELQELPVDAIKIDRAFIAELENCDPRRSIAAILVDLADIMEVGVVAEGLETVRQRQALKELGCTRGQGYLLGRPVSSDEFRSRWPIGRTAAVRAAA